MQQLACEKLLMTPLLQDKRLWKKCLHVQLDLIVIVLRDKRLWKKSLYVQLELLDPRIILLYYGWHCIKYTFVYKSFRRHFLRDSVIDKSIIFVLSILFFVRFSSVVKKLFFDNKVHFSKSFSRIFHLSSKIFLFFYFHFHYLDLHGVHFSFLFWV